jgi:glycosyltransferase involved in cell wall biosynthesis
MACGCAVVATDSGGPRDIIKDGENGFLVEVGKVDEIVGKVKLLLNNDGLRRRIVKNARKTVKNFNWGSSIDKLEEALQTIN